MDEPQRLICNDPTDVLGRKVTRFELVDQPLIAIDLAKRYAGDGETRFTEPTTVRYLDKQDCLYLIAWLNDAVEYL